MQKKRFSRNPFSEVICIRSESNHFIMEETIHVLYFENDVRVANMVKSILERYEFSVRITADKTNAWDMLRNSVPDILLLETELQEEKDAEFLKQIRKENQDLPIILYSAYIDNKKEITALQLGIDDCISKGCQSELLLAKLRRIHKRSEINKHNYILSPNSTFNASAHTLHIHGKHIQLGSMEGRLLHLLCLKLHEIVELEYLKTELWGECVVGKDSALRKYITALRQTLAIDSSITIINNRSLGYCLTCR